MSIILMMIVITGTMLSVGLCRMVAPATETERLADDEAQNNYLREWCERQRRS